MKKYLLSALLAVSSFAMQAQTTDPVVMTVNGKDIYLSEFEYIYNKNNNEQSIDKKTLDEYLELFKVFKLKVAEAELQGLDTTTVFHNELNDYRTQLAKSYKQDMEINEELLKEMYASGMDYYDLSFIMLAYDQLHQSQYFELLPSDTLAIYKKAMDVRAKALKKGADFGKLVVEYTDMERAKQGDRPGHIGWELAMSLMPEMEKAITATPVGSVSMPVRTPYGYYLFKVHGKKANPGSVDAAHILIECPQDADVVREEDALNKITQAYEQAMEGKDFNELALVMSQDPSAQENKGELGRFGYGRMVEEFQDAAFAMEPGEISKPIRSPFGFHVIKINAKYPADPYEEVRANIIEKLQQTGAYDQLYAPGIAALKIRNEVTPNQAVYNEMMTLMQTLTPSDSLFLDKYRDDQREMLSVVNKSYTIADFMEFLNTYKRSNYNLSTDYLADKMNEFEMQVAQQSDEDEMANRYPEFKHLLQEYRDGILLFEVSNNEVWNKASSDTTGLKQFFEENIEKYAWSEPRYKGYVVLAKDKATAKKMKKEIKKMDADKAAYYLINNYKVGEVSYVNVEKGLFAKGGNPYVDQEVFKTGKAQMPEEYQTFFLMGKLLKRLPEAYTDVRGQVITDYQDYLEKQWVESLKAKFPIDVNQAVVNSLK